MKLLAWCPFFEIISQTDALARERKVLNGRRGIIAFYYPTL